MKQTNKPFLIAWAILLLLMIVSCIVTGWNEDAILAGIAFALSLCSTWLCHIRGSHKTALGNLIAMIVYNSILCYNLIFNSQYGAGLTWWFFMLVLNTVHSTALFVLVIVQAIKFKSHKTDR